MIISACISRISHNWKLSYILHQIWLLLDSFQEVQISHTLREGNRLADHLANKGCDGYELVAINDDSIINHDAKLKEIYSREIVSCAVDASNVWM